MAEWSKGWIRLYHEVIIDDKMGLLSDHLWRRAVECMVAAGAEGRGGYLPETKALARKLATTEADLEHDLIELAAPGVKILEKRPDGWYVVNHIKRQQAKDATGAARQERYRKAQQEKHDALRNALRDGVTDASHNTPRREEVKEEKESKKRTRPPKPAKEPDATLTAASVVVYREECHLTPNEEQRKLILATVTDPERWRSVLKDWAGHGWNMRNVAGQLDMYNKSNGKPARNGNGRHADDFTPDDDPQLAAAAEWRATRGQG